EQLFLVFDFGGGTTDACVVRTNGEGPAEVVATYGDNGLGGNDLTRAVAGYVVDRFLASHELHVANDECDRLCRILGARASEAKVHLSDALSARSVPDA
ncbi:MAG: molecular chaperone DnaK, partial [Armatimonadetes bacterium]|nr:molecular chaperone DnaK [Armatimonadota bacterium]